MRNLVHDTARQRFDRLFLLRRKYTQLSAQPLHLRLADLFQSILEHHDRRRGFPRLQPKHQPFHLFGDDLLGLLRFLQSPIAVRLNYFLQIVNVVQEDIVDLIHRRLDIAGNCNVDQEHWTVAAYVDRTLHVLAGNDVLGRTAGGNHDVHLRQRLLELFILHHFAIEQSSHGIGSRARSIGHEYARSAGPPQMARREFSHLTRAHQQHLAIFKRAENLARQLHRGIAHAHGVLPYLRLRAYALCDAECAREHKLEETVHCASRFCRRVCAFQLAQDLRLADHH